MTNKALASCRPGLAPLLSIIVCLCSSCSEESPEPVVRFGCITDDFIIFETSCEVEPELPGNIESWDFELINGEPVYRFAEEFPKPRGGDVEHPYQFLSVKGFSCNGSGLNEVVFVETIINKEGTPTLLRVVRGSGWECLDKEALRVISSSRWSAGKINGVEVLTKTVWPVRFVVAG